MNEKTSNLVEIFSNLEEKVQDFFYQMWSAIVLKCRNDLDFKEIVVDWEKTQSKKFEWILSLLRLPISLQRRISVLIDHNIITYHIVKVKWYPAKLYYINFMHNHY